MPNSTTIVVLKEHELGDLISQFDMSGYNNLTAINIHKFVELMVIECMDENGMHVFIPIHNNNGQRYVGNGYRNPYDALSSIIQVRS